MKSLTALGIGLALSFGVASAASAKTCADHQRHTANRDAAYGAVGGALLGNAVSHGGGKTGGTLIGAAAGGLIGHQVGKNRASCDYGKGNRGYHYANGRRYYYDRHHHRHYY